MPNFFIPVISVVSLVRTKESMGGYHTTPKHMYFGLKHIFKEDIEELINFPYIRIDNIDQDISTDNYSTFFPCYVNEDRIENNTDYSMLLDVYKLSGRMLFPRLITSNDEVVHQLIIKSADKFLNVTEQLLVELKKYGFEASVLMNTSNQDEDKPNDD